jgi:putative flavoprotein involved in K+ transport
MTDLSKGPTGIAGAWLADFAAALQRKAVEAAVALFAPECY